MNAGILVENTSLYRVKEDYQRPLHMLIVVLPWALMRGNPRHRTEKGSMSGQAEDR